MAKSSITNDHSSPVVDVRKVSKTFVQSGPWPWSAMRQVFAVREVSIQVHPGEVIALVGQSGSGKTTLARLVLGLENVTSGEIYLNQQRWDNLNESQRRALRASYQYVPQDAMAALDPQQTALEHTAETYRVLGGLNRREARHKAEKLLTTLGLEQRFDALPREMSGGEQRRVTLARVLALSPSLVVADEPTSGLDPERRESVLEALIGNLPEHAGCILVTHDMSEAREWCDRIYVMLNGQVVEVIEGKGTKPKHPYARLLYDPWSVSSELIQAIAQRHSASQSLEDLFAEDDAQSGIDGEGV